MNDSWVSRVFPSCLNTDNNNNNITTTTTTTTTDNTAYLLEVGGGLHLADGGHERVSHEDGQVGSGVALRLAAHPLEVRVRDDVVIGAQIQPEHVYARLFVREGDVDALLKPRDSSKNRTAAVRRHTS